LNAPESCIHQAALEHTAWLASLTPPGAFVEVGVYKGGCAWYLERIAQRQGRELHLFDTFTGIPHKGPGDHHNVGDFGDTSLEAVKAAVPSAIFHAGVFPDTLPADLMDIAFVHCDVDQTESVRAVINQLWGRMVIGGVMAFDDMNQDGASALIKWTFGDRLKESGGVWHVEKVA